MLSNNKILVSACLCGEKCRYNGSSVSNNVVDTLEQKNIIKICPELLGGLLIPREPCEIVGGTASDVIRGNAKILGLSGKNYTKQYMRGVKEVINITKKNNVKMAVLKQKSPSCGYGKVYNGEFSGKIIEGNGILAEELLKMGIDSFVQTRLTMSRSKMLSSDVSAGVDPLFVNVNDKKNAAYLGNGIVFNKYTGSRGKSGSNDASAEYVAQVRAVMDNANIHYQTAELGRVDQGGGGTIAYILGNYNMDVIDAGIAVLNMHAPMEIVSKVDVYETYQAYKAFLKDA